MKVAAIQFRPEYGQVQSNARSCRQYAESAALQGAELVVFPELALSGYSMMSEEEAAQYATSEEELRKFQSLSDRMDIAIAIGVILPGEGCLYNGQVLFRPRQRPVHYYKINLWGQDWLWAREGKIYPPVVEYKGVRVGLLICADVRNKQSDPWEGTLYEKGDADIVVYSSNWGKGAFPSGRWIHFARDEKVALVVGNRYGTEANNDFGVGGIGVIDSTGKVFCDGLKWGEDCMVLHDLA